MNKSAFGLVALAFAGAASAQSSVTLFGVMDASFSYYQTKSEYYNLPGLSGTTSAKQSQTALSPSGYNSSRLGLRGTEDLGGGISANYWLEAPVSNDTGGASIAFTRRSTVSLSGTLGELRLGRDYTATFWNDGVFDPLTVNGVGTNLIAVVNSNLAVSRSLATGGLLGGGASAGTDNYLRTSNSVGYFLPAGLGGFYGQVQYAFHEQVKYDPGATTPVALNNSRTGGYAGGRFGYANNALDIALAYGASTVGDNYFLGTTTLLKTANLGPSYDLGVLKLSGE